MKNQEKFLQQKKEESIKKKQELMGKLTEDAEDKEVTACMVEYQQGRIDLINELLCYLGDNKVKFDMNNGIEDYE